MNNLPHYIANMRKAIIQVATLIVTLGTAVATYTQLPDKYAAIITGAVALAGSVLHYATPNAPAPGTGTAEDPYQITDLIQEGEDILDEWKPVNPDLVTTSQVSSSLPPDPQQPAVDGAATPDATAATPAATPPSS